MSQWIIATRNRHKCREIEAILGVECRTLDDLPGAPALVEDADTFAGNATGKALQLAAWLRASGKFMPVMADDSGLEVDALNGAPGVHSARFAAIETGHEGNSTDLENNARLLRLLEGIPSERRTARFRCVIAITNTDAPLPTESITLFEGVCEGRILTAPRGAGGFGYDPLFMPEGCAVSFAELGAGEKNRISHRARALQQLTIAVSQRSLPAGIPMDLK